MVISPPRRPPSAVNADSADPPAQGPDRSLGGAQGYVLAGQGRRALALPWALAMPVLFALGWSAASITGVGVDDQFTVFGAGGALLFTLLSGLLLARFMPPGAPGA